MESTRTPPDAVLEGVLEAYERGQTMDALERAQAFAPLEDWAGVPGCSLAMRIASNMGGNRLALRLAARLWRADKRHPLAQFEYGFQLLHWRGPLAFWLGARTWPALKGGNARDNAEFVALKSRIAADFRDFNFSERLIDEAEAIAPGVPWVRLQRAHLLENLEKIEEALETASAACKLHPHPFYRPGVQTVAHLLQLLDRDEEAIQVLREADAQLQSAQLALQLYGVLADTRQWAAAEDALERFALLSPLIEPPGKLWLQSQRARAAYHLGRRSRALELAGELKDPFHRQFAANLAQPAPATEQVRFEVPFVRQQFKTCAPASLAALARHWKMPAEHLALVEAICYDGTPSWQQRDWAEHNGWLVREFRVTWEDAMALLTRGVPFAISTVEATSAHMQAVIGFDQTRRVLLLRDPSQPYCVEAQAEVFFKRYRPFGPRGMVLLPVAEAARLNGLTLPDAELYDALHVLSLALSKHDRPKAHAALAQLESKWPDDALTWEGRLDMASYDANRGEELRCLDRLLELFPGNPARLLRKLHTMRDAAREEWVEFLKKECVKPSVDPALYVELARNLVPDAPQQVLARQWLGRAMRVRPLDSNIMGALADLRWKLGQYDEATELYRFAATVEGYREPLYQAWFVACRQVRQTEAALAHLEDRLRRLGNRSSQPALTFAWALREIEQPERARKVLAEALQLRPDDGYLVLRAATLNARLGAMDQAAKLLVSARGKVRENDWLRAAAECADCRFEIKSLLDLNREILALEPLAVDAHRGVARALNQLEGRAAAVAHLKDACARHPHHCGLQRLLIEWSRGAGFEAVIESARAFLKTSPRDAWTRRELAVALAQADRLDEALAEAEEASRIDPRSPGGERILGHIHERLRRYPDAHGHFRQAIALNVDDGDSMAALLRLAKTDKERIGELAFVEQELVRQVVHGDGLLAFMRAARPLLEPAMLLKILTKAHDEHPDLWHAASALVHQLDHLGRHDEALATAKKTAERFPHLPRVWLDLAAVHRHRKEADAEIAAAERAFEINPGWNQTAFALSDALTRCRSLNDAKAIYERALRLEPSDAQLHDHMASVLWRLRQPSEAFSHIEKALRLAPGDDYAWNLLVSWSADSGQPERPVEFARALTREHPGDVNSWLKLARVLSGAEAFQGRMDAINRALELDTHLMDAWDFKAQLLAGALKFDDAIKTCEQGIAHCPTGAYMLRGRRAWIDAQRNQIPQAISLMREVLAENAGYAWGWRNLALWLTNQKAYGDAEGAIRQLLKLEPHDHWAQRQMAFVLIQQGDKAGAQKVFSTVLDASPTDEQAAANLFELQLEMGNLNGASETLRRMQTHQPGARTLAREVILDARAGNTSAALETFKTLCAQPDPDSWPVGAAADKLVRYGLQRRAMKVLKRASVSASSSPQAGPVAVHYLLNKRQSLQAIWLFGRIRSAEGRKRAAAVLAQGLGKLRTAFWLQIVLLRYREYLFKDDAAWGQVGYALANLRRWRGVVRWMTGWRSRPNVEPWMLFNLAFAMRHLGRYPEAVEIAEFGVQKWGHSREASGGLRLILAVEKALAGSAAEAMEQLQRVKARENVPYDQRLLAIARTLVEFQQTPANARKQHFAVVRRELGRHFSIERALHAGGDVRRTLRRAGKVFVRNGGGIRAWLWFHWKLDWPWLIPAVLGVWVLWVFHAVH